VECKNKSDTVIIGATGTTSQCCRKYLSNMPGQHMKELQAAALMDTAPCPHTSVRINVQVQRV